MRSTAKLLLVAALMGAAVVSAWSVSAHGYQLEYTFEGGDDGNAPDSGMIEVGSLLYGTTTKGGVGASGTIFSLDPATGTKRTLYSFLGGADGANPWGSLINFKGKLYGATMNGGGSQCGGTGCGTLFSFDPVSRVENTLHAFPGSDQATPNTMLAVGKKLYGVTTGGGGNNGTIFTLDPKTNTVETVYRFTGGDGQSPIGPPILVDGMLYGVTYAGGDYKIGVVYKFDPVKHTEAVVHEFGVGGGGGGAVPLSGLTEVGGILYGTTVLGGAGPGVVFSVDPATGAEQVVHDFQGTGDGSEPTHGSLALVNGTLYGVTSLGGINGCGAVYSVDPATGAEKVIHSFDCTRPSSPDEGVFYIDHRLFGTLLGGGNKQDCGTSGCGGLFSIKP
jgi:uncharacterized repeat protein (TIGR03803 family)